MRDRDETRRPPLPEGYAVRPAARADLGRLADVELAAGVVFRDVGMVDIAEDRGPGLEVLEPACAEGRLWVAVHGDGAVGYALGILVGGQPHLEQISVAADHGRRGLGAALMAEVDRWARNLGAEQLTLSTFRDVPWNAPYYASLGFEVVSEEDLTPELSALRAGEADHGLDVGSRVIMARRIDRPDGGM